MSVSDPFPFIAAPAPTDADTAAEVADLAGRAGIRRVHFLAWRDLDDPEAGGSEVHASTVAGIWANAGLEVVMRTSFAAGRPSEVERDGYRVVRRAGRYLLFPRAALAEVTRSHGPRDAVVEIWNGMPVLSPAWTRRPKVIVLHHVHAEMWRMVLPPGLARFGNAIESRWAPPLYRHEHVVTLSDSAKSEIVGRLGFDERRVDVVPPGVHPRFSPGPEPLASRPPNILAVGRLVPVKQFDRLIRASAEAHRLVPNLRLTIVGQGYENNKLHRLVRQLDAEGWVTFTDSVRDEELVSLYRTSRLIASASAREGWGMTLTEAAACGTPAVATRVVGHTDAVADGVSGLLADDERQLASLIAKVAIDDELHQRLVAGALEHSQRFTWNNTALGVFRALAQEANARGHRGRRGRWR
jgi:glycosyltransferase involved in cell wall biosynthesis